ncbi:MAG: membrane protein [Pirellulaceae bacterium]|nr:MAG: membrane protein [Pirellulaceae bacterium]
MTRLRYWADGARHTPVAVSLFLLFTVFPWGVALPEEVNTPRAYIDGTEPGWQLLGQEDFVNVNCDQNTWKWQDGVLFCTGRPVGVLRSKELYTNFELIVEWRHLQPAGNSGVFIWTPPESLAELAPNKLPSGIEVQILDHAFAEQYEQRTGRKADWFTTHGDVFAVGSSKMTPFPPTSPNGSRSFPRKQLSRGVNQWNHYYIRAINGEVRLWVNGQEVSGGTGCQPSTGHVCLESEGAPIEFRNIRVRRLP